MNHKRIAVVGGGAAGLMAAIAAAEGGGQVTLLEPNDRLGKKTEHHRQWPVQRDQQLLPGGASAEHPPERAVSVRGLRPVRQPGRHGLF